MSPLSRDRLLIGFSPSGAACVRMHGRSRPRIVERTLVPCAPGEGPASWPGAVAALRTALAGVSGENLDAILVLSNHFVRYALLRWSAALSGAEEEQVYLRHHLVRIFGERARSWTARASAAPDGEPRLASAVDSGLLEAIAQCFSGKGAMRLSSVQPYLMAAYNRWRAAVPAAGAWLLLLEPGRACLALHAAGRWRALRNVRGDFTAPAEIADLLERERRQIDGGVPELVLVHADFAVEQEIAVPGWTVRLLPLIEGRYGPALAAA